jgi:hypothetical protein
MSLAPPSAILPNVVTLLKACQFAGATTPFADAGLKDIVKFWHSVVLDTHLKDFSGSGTPQQPGPTYTTRAMAMAHVAMYDAYVGMTKDAATYYSYPNIPTVTEGSLLYC